MTTKNKGIIFSSVLIVIMIALVGFDIFLVEKTKSLGNTKNLYLFLLLNNLKKVEEIKIKI